MNDQVNDHATNPNRLSPADRYLRDPQFHALVTTMECMIAKAEFTPTEIREAAMYAAIRQERKHAFRTMMNAKCYFKSLIKDQGASSS